jgi:hypothetical protein
MMSEGGVYLVLKLLAIDRFPALAGARWVATLYHETRHHAVKLDSIVVISCGQRRKVL